MRQIISSRTYLAMYRLLDRVSPVQGDCGRLCGSICCTVENRLLLTDFEKTESIKTSDDIFLYSEDIVNKVILFSEPEEQVLGIYLYPGEESLFLPPPDRLLRGENDIPVFRNAAGIPQFAFETEDAEEYDYPDSWTGDVWFASCLLAPHCERKKRPLQCRFYPAAPHISRGGNLTLIWFPDTAQDTEMPYRCPLIEERYPLNRDFLKATYTVCRHLMRDPRIYDLFLFDSAARREDPDFNEDDRRLYP